MDRTGRVARWLRRYGVAEVFGIVAALLDTLLVRPLAMGLGVRFLGQDAGIVAGKLAADVTFYVPVVLTYELRRQARQRTGA